MGKNKLMVSIDWDFFLYRACEVPSEKAGVTLFPGTEREVETSLFGFFDWGHNENHGPLLQQILWHSRYAAFCRAELDPHVICGHREDLGGVAPSKFLDQWFERFDSNDADILYADSHSWGYPVIRDRVTKADKWQVIHFDAHADLGYDAQQLAWETEMDRWDCSSWLYHALRKRLVDTALIVYPDWKGLHEWEVLQEYEFVKSLGDRVTAMTYSQWVAAGGPAEAEVEIVNVARSSTWTPPWFDGKFDEFMSQLPGNMVCLECMYAETPEADHACTPRSWDPGPAEFMFGYLAQPLTIAK